MIDLDNLKKHLLAGTRIDPDCIPETGPVILPKEMALADLEPYLAEPYRHRGTYTTALLDEFIAYIQSNVDESLSPHCFIADRGLREPTAEAIFDFGDPAAPRWREHRAVLDIEPSEAYAALQSLFGRNLTQDDLTTFIDDWSSNCVFERPDGTIVAPAVARTEFADLTVEQVKSLRSKQADFNRERSAVERMSMGTGLPNRLHFTCEPWLGLSTQRLTLRIAAADSAGSLALRLTLIGWPLVRSALVDELLARIGTAPITIRRGMFSLGRLRPISAGLAG